MTVTANLEEIVETLSKLSVLDLSNLKKLLEEKWDVKAAAAAVAVAAPVAGGQDAPAAEEATEFDVKLTAIDATKKIAIIKAVREATGLGLKEAKDLVEAAPSEIKKGAAKAEAQEIKTKIEAAGGTVVLTGL